MPMLNPVTLAPTVDTESAAGSAADPQAAAPYSHMAHSAWELAVLYDIATTLASTFDPERIFTLLVGGLDEMFNVTTVALALSDEAKGTLRIEVVDKRKRTPPIILPLDEGGLVSQIIRTGEPLLIEDLAVAQDALPRIPYTSSEAPSTWMGVPLIIRDRAIGALSVQSNEPHRFDRHDLRLLTQLAQQVAVVVENTRLMETLRQQAEQMAFANETMHEIAVQHSVAALTQTLAQKIQANFGYDRVCVALLEEAGLKPGLKIRAAVQAPGVDDRTLPPWQPETENSAVARVMTSHQTVLVPISLDRPDDMPANTLVGEQRCELVLPLTAKGQVIGVLDIVGLHDPQDTGRLELMQALVGSLAIAVNRAQLFEAAETGQREARTLYSLSRQMTSLDLERIPERLLEQLGNLIPNDVAGLLVAIDGILHSFFHISQPVGGAALKKLELRMLDHWPALTSPAPTAAPIQRHVQDAEDVLPDDTPALHSDIYALLLVGERPLGALTVARTGPMEFEEADQRLLSTIANQAATAIENALLYRKLKGYAASLEQRVAERTVEIARQKERTEAILHSVADAVLVTDLQGEITLANERARHLLDGQLCAEEREYLIGRVREWGLRASEGVDEIVELGDLALQARATPISEEDPSLGSVVLLSDVSRLRELDRMKTRFVSNVSHELRTPISNVKLYLSLLERGKPEKRARYLEVLQQESTRLETLIETLLDLSRLDAGRAQVIPRPVVLQDLLANLVEIHRQAAAAKDSRLETQFPPQVPPANGDRNQIIQVLSNLITNAISYTPPGGEIAIRLGTAEAEGCLYVTITVADSGIGIPPGELPHVFDRFFRGEQAQISAVPGTGLGLAIVKEIVDLHQGRIEVESEVDEGSTFTVWLPAAAPPQDAGQHSNPVITQSATTPQRSAQ